MTAVEGRGRRRHFLLLLLSSLVLLTATAVVLVRSASDLPPTAPPATSVLRVQPDATDDPGLPATDDLTAQIQAVRDGSPEPVFHRHANGSVSADLGRRFMKMSVATVDADGHVHTTCVDAAASHPESRETAASGQER